MQPQPAFERRETPWRTLAGFARDVYAPGLHLAFAAAWFLALDAGLSAMHGLPRWNASAPVGIAVLFLALFFLRVVDEWKDYDYDAVYNPGRPLVRGAVRFTDLYWYHGGTAVLTLALDLIWRIVSGVSLFPAAILCLDLLYGVALVFVERASRTVRDNILLNLLVTYPVNVLLSIYIWVAWLVRTGEAPAAGDALLAAAFALAFLHYEFARKIAWPEHAKPGRRLYSAALGAPLALAAAIAFAGGSVLLIARLLPAFEWLAAVPLVPVVAGVVQFVRVRRTPLTPFAMVFITLFYLSVLAIATIG